MVKKITFRIDDQGEVKIEVDGAVGSSCEDFTAPFEELLGSVSKKEYKDAYYENNQTDNSITSIQ